MKIVAIFCLILGYTMIYDALSRVKGEAYKTNTMLRLLGFTDTGVHNSHDIFGISTNQSATGDTGTAPKTNGNNNGNATMQA